MPNILKRIYEIPGAGDRFRSMEGLRAYGALLIFLVHYFDAYIRDVFNVDPNTLSLSEIADTKLQLSYYFFASHYGVDIFFFLSGFLICRMVTRSDFNFVEFLAHRFKRIYPAAFIAILLWAYVRINVQQWYDFGTYQFIGNLFFLNAVPALEVKPFATITWSLFYEMLFYISFPLILLVMGKEQKLHPGKVILFAIVYVWVAQLLGGMYIRFWMFFGGAIMATLATSTLSRLAQRTPTWFVMMIFIGSTLIFSEWLRYDYFIPVFVITTFFFVVKVLYGNGLLKNIFSITPIRYLGNISFSFYLMHGFGIELIMYQYRAFFEPLDGVWFLTVTFSLCLLLSVLFSTGLFLLAERPYFQHKKTDHAATVGTAIKQSS